MAYLVDINKSSFLFCVLSLTLRNSFSIFVYKNTLKLLFSLIIEAPTKNWENGGESKAEVAEQSNNLRGRKRRWFIVGEEGVEREQVDVDSGSTSHIH